jgi:hypothetical protein
MLEDTVYYRAFRNPGRHQDCRNAHTESVEFELLTCSSLIGGCDKSVGYALRWNNVIVETTMFVVQDQPSRTVQEIFITSDRAIHRSNKEFSYLYVVVWVLVRRENFTVPPFMILMIRVDEAIVRKSTLHTVNQELIVCPK